MNKKVLSFTVGVASLLQSCNIKDTGMVLNYVSGPTTDTVKSEGGDEIYKIFTYNFSEKEVKTINGQDIVISHPVIVHIKSNAQLINMLFNQEITEFQNDMPKNLEYGDNCKVIYNDNYIKKVGDTLVIAEAGRIENLEPDTKFGNSYHFDDKIQ